MNLLLKIPSSGGEPLIGLPVVLEYPFYDPVLGQLFPFRTLCMLISLVSHVVISLVTHWLFHKQYLPSTWDVLYCFHNLQGRNDSCDPDSATGEYRKKKDDDSNSCYRISDSSLRCSYSLTNYEFSYETPAYSQFPEPPIRLRSDVNQALSIEEKM